MTRPREVLISLSDTPYYHITSRCARRAFLCGMDHYSGQSYEHRRQWVVDRIRLLSSLFAIDVCAYVALSNHYHLVAYRKHNPPIRARASRSISIIWGLVLVGFSM